MNSFDLEGYRVLNGISSPVYKLQNHSSLDNTEGSPTASQPLYARVAEIIGVALRLGLTSISIILNFNSLVENTNLFTVGKTFI